MTQVTDRWISPAPQPNGLQAADDGLWLIDQHDNHLYKLDYADGSVLVRVPTESDHSSGVTLGGGYLWVASTFGSRIYKLNSDGTTVAHYDTPGKGVVAFVDPTDALVTGAHGLQWLDQRHMWMAVPPAQKLFLVDPRTMDAHRSIPTPVTGRMESSSPRVTSGVPTSGCARSTSSTRPPERSGPRLTCPTPKSTA